MALELLNQNTVQIVKNKHINWQEAIKLASAPLVKEGRIGQDYVENMINAVETVGPYFNIGPGIALAHSRPIPSVRKISLTLLKTDYPVNLLDESHPVKLWFVLAATDNKSHLKVIQELAALLMDKNKNKELMNAESVNELLDVLQGE